MIRIAITTAAFEAISATLPLGSVGFEREPAAQGERQIWVDAAVVDRLTAMRGPGESYSDIILKLVELETAAKRGSWQDEHGGGDRLPGRGQAGPAQRWLLLQTQGCPSLPIHGSDT